MKGRETQTTIILYKRIRKQNEKKRNKQNEKKKKEKNGSVYKQQDRVNTYIIKHLETNSHN